MKRKLSNVGQNLIKRARVDTSYTIDNTWVTASETRNFILGDPFSDWMKLWLGKRASPTPTPYSSPQQTPSTPANPPPFLLQQGNVFEEIVYNRLKEKFSPKEIAHVGIHHFHAKSNSAFEKTVDAIEKRVPIIYGGVLHNPETKTYGIPDLIVRRDYLPKIFSSFKFGENGHDTGSTTNTQDTYAIVDIKFSTISLKADGLHILNTSSFPAYKAQLNIYNEALNRVQPVPFTNAHAYILGRGTKFSRRGEVISTRDPFDLPGVITYTKDHDDSVGALTKKAVAWIRDVKTQGDQWDPYAPSRPEMYPNMCRSDFDSGNAKAFKEKVAKKIGEITDVWMCGESARKHAHLNGVFSWHDARCTSTTLGINDGKNAELIDAILNFNRTCMNDVSDDNLCIEYDISVFDEIGDASPNEFFIDFEMVSDTSADGIFSSSSIFMIGVCHVDVASTSATGVDRCVTKIFSTNDISPSGEFDVCSQFVDYIHEQTKKCNSPIKFYHWSPTERWRWDKFVKTTSARFQRSLEKKSFEFIDLCKIFRDYHVLVNGCLNFKLKTIAKRLHELGCIQTTWPKNASITDGFSAISELYAAIKNADDEQLKGTIVEIERYNTIDVQVMYEIIEYLRSLK